MERYLKDNHTLMLITKSTANTENLKNIKIIKVPDWYPKHRIISGLSYIIFAIYQIFLNRENIDVIHAKQMYSAAIIGAFANYFFKIPVVSKNTATNEVGEIAAMKKLPFYRLRLLILKQVNYFIALTSQAKKEVMSIGIPEERIEVIPNGVVITDEVAYKNETRSKYKQILALDKEFVMIYTGRFAEEKNLDIIIEAINLMKRKRDLSRFQCVFLGEGGKFRNKESELRSKLAEYELESIIKFYPPVNNVYPFLLASDVFFLLSTSEGLSNALLEAMACGNIILATDIDANRDFLVNKKNALLVPVRDIEKTREMLEWIMDNRNNCTEFAKNARKKIEESVDIEVIYKKHLNLYQRAIDDKGKK